ncbi:hypothetical protein NMY22_g14095 [Coprinellus aureogranulatus]|nr:hypothetical protein NMY22_g14095 [Coprinellus aureogranulatus]
MSYGAVPQNNSPYGASNAAYGESSTGFINNSIPQKKKGLSPWIKFGIPVLIVVVVAAVVGGVLGTRKKSGDGASSSGSGSSGDKDGAVDSKAPIATATDILAAGVFATATQSKSLHVLMHHL